MGRARPTVRTAAASRHLRAGAGDRHARREGDPDPGPARLARRAVRGGEQGRAGRAVDVAQARVRASVPRLPRDRARRLRRRPPPRRAQRCRRGRGEHQHGGAGRARVRTLRRRLPGVGRQARLRAQRVDGAPRARGDRSALRRGRPGCLRRAGAATAGAARPRGAAAAPGAAERRGPPRRGPRPRRLPRRGPRRRAGGRGRPPARRAARGVRFGYRPDRPVLDGLDLELPVGSSTALIGVNGAGKTTLVKVLTGTYVPDEGRVTVDGTDLRTLDRDAWQAAFAVTFQEFLRYPVPLRENVAMGAVAHRDDDAGLRDCLRRVGLGALLDELPQGLDTPLTRAVPGGRDLSGGQWQRLALARALFAVRHGASVLVLDEPTSQLDARGEAEFYDGFLELTRGVTSLVISHRFATLRRADRIVVLDGGRVVESGTHDELVELDGRYGRMFEVQARRFRAAAGGAPR
ncbi:ATP-binding cassette domain-containing protein [Cellulomonas sp. JZ18]|nr:ATP-binding cassette domain-containing protein [Cellulomonas sp. JZ18]